MMRAVLAKQSNDPMTVSLTASKPLPCNRSLWPGSTAKAESASGAPKYIEGIESRKVWVTDIEMINTGRALHDPQGLHAAYPSQ